MVTTTRYRMPRKIKNTIKKELIKHIAALHPEMSCNDIGEMFRISRQRVLKILGRRPLEGKND